MIQQLRLRAYQIWKFLFAPKYQNKDLARRELVLNILLCGSLVLSFLATFISWLYTFSQGKLFREESMNISLIFLLFLVMYLISRAGKAKWISYIFIFFYLSITFQSAYTWGADFSQGVLIYALIVVMSGILINSRFAFFVSLIISFITTWLITMQNAGTVHVINDWRETKANIGDGIMISITLMIIALVSWLFNQEMERALKRARISEKELKKERDLLEEKVEERTRELKRMQLEKITQLYRFAEVGRLTAGFMHDLVNPISLISLNLHNLNRQSQQKELVHIKILLKRALSGTRYLENFVISARQQLQNQEVQRTFSLNYEIKQIIHMLTYKANKMGVKIIFEPTATIKTFGNPIKFNQIIMNLALNAIDSYDMLNKDNRKVLIALHATEKDIKLTIQDWGTGISKDNVKKIFEPFFTTKPSEKGTGLGLSITKDVVKQSFHGKISVKSTEKNGTIFIITFPILYPKMSHRHEED